MEITDYTKEFNILQRKCGRHAPIFPTNIFCVLGGATGSGKSNLMLNLLKKEKMLNYSNVYVYSSTLYQPAYVHLKEYYETFENLIKRNTGQNVKIAQFFDS